MYELKLAIVSMLIPYMSNRQASNFMKAVESILDQPPQLDIMKMNLNPIRVGLLLYKVIDQVQQESNYSNYVTKIMKDKITEKILKILDLYDSPEQIIPLAELPDIEGKKCFSYLLEYELYTILDTKLFDRYMIDKWQGWIDQNADLLDFCTSHMILQNKHDHMKSGKIFGLLLDDIFNFRRPELTHSCKFFVWKHSMQFRFFIEGVFTLMLTIIFQYYVQRYNTFLHGAEEDNYQLEQLKANGANHSSAEYVHL